MTEQDVMERERNAFVEGAKWMNQGFMPHVGGVSARIEAARRFPEIDVQQGPSGKSYRVIEREGSNRTFVEIRGWDTEEAARRNLGSYWIGVDVGDETTVIKLLQRHAARRGGA